MPTVIGLNLTPGAIAAADYDTAQTPAWGGEREVYLTTQTPLFLGIATLTADATISYEYINKPVSRALTGTVSSTASTNVLTGTGTKFRAELAIGDIIIIESVREAQVVAGISSDTSLTTVASTLLSHTDDAAAVHQPIVAFVMTGLRSANVAAAVSFGTIGSSVFTGSFTPAAYAQNQTFDFAAGRGVELVSEDFATVFTSLIVPTVTLAKRGSKFGLIQLPSLGAFRHVGCTTSKDIVVPVRGSKSISCGLDSSRFVKPGKTSEGKLTIKAKDAGEEDGLHRFKGLKCVAMIQTTKEESVLTSRQFCPNFTPSMSISNPDSDGEADQSAEGMFQHLITLVAPGS